MSKLYRAAIPRDTSSNPEIFRENESWKASNDTVLDDSISKGSTGRDISHLIILDDLELPKKLAVKFSLFPNKFKSDPFISIPPPSSDIVVCTDSSRHLS
mmetsp:Transcript_4804/g.6711  ORF Transcript_4804/g.6711 Transcript_4804/m.6711 type:complete len:100 (+) Transcript_4804:523-822(+)